ncbi:hypothetical protein [Nocardia miyunensis]|uniref:hypothetical protein n=1 Tax=Nocardia miyunensis TaxID=282684 RepID=UPI000832616A|nr:hypothetical protein [Nocardia miyunensis]
MPRKVLLATMIGVLIAAPATASADVTAGAVANRNVAAHEIEFNTGSGVADTIINGLILAIFGPDDPMKCKFPYCF